MTETDMQIMRKLMERDAAVMEALAHPRLCHCVACDHEWALYLGMVCDWCGSEGREIS